MATELGLSSFKVDLAVRNPGDEEWRVAVMVDGDGWASRPTVSDRDGAPQLLVDLMGWPATLRVWLPAWRRDRAGVLERVREAMERPVVERPRYVSVAAHTDAPVAEPGEAAVPSTGPEVVASPLVLDDFTVAADSVIASQSVLGNIRMAVPVIERIAGEVLETEGPIPLARLVATVARRFGYSRIGEGKRNDLVEVIRGSFRTVDGFAWPAALDPATWRSARRSPSTAARAVNEISPHEIANVVELLLRESFSITRDDLAKEASEVLGYARLTEQARAWLAQGIDLAVAEGRAVVDGDRVRLP